MKHININKSHWDSRVSAHVSSDFYDQTGFLKGRNTLNQIELDLMGDVSGKEILHLQCHFGQDTLSLARMGAKVYGVDFSSKAIEVAKETTRDLGLDAQFICCDVFELPSLLDKKFDLVFASYGVIGWHPDIDAWASLVDGFLKQGGRHLLVEFHPCVWMFAEDFSEIQYSYFNTGPIVETSDETYADKSTGNSSSSICWNHGTGEVLTAFLSKGLRLTAFYEYDYSPYDCFQRTVKVESGYQIRGLEGKIPMVFAMQVHKPT